MSLGRVEQLNPSPEHSGLLLQRKCSCGGQASGLTGECTECAQRLQRKLAIGPADDQYEREADRIAEQVVGGSPGNAPTVHPATATPLRRKSDDGGAGGAAVPPVVNQALRSPGEPLGNDARAFFEPRLGHDFAKVRVHTDGTAAASARAVQARAYTVGQDLVFAAGQYAPHSQEGKRLLAHELTHVTQQSQVLRRAPAAKAPADPLCETFNFASARKAVEAQAKKASKTADLLPLIRALKPIRRCATAKQQTEVKDSLSSSLSTAKADEAWAAAGTAFGGYVGFYPGYAPDVKTHLDKLGTSESLKSNTFELSSEGKTHKTRAKKAGAGDVADLERTDIVYFRGHQYAQYKAPGLFANGDESKGFDLRYVEKKGGFGNVKLMISTSCATLCQEAASVFSGLFPNAVILGYRKSAPLEGAAVRADLTKRINELNRPLLLDQPVDVAAIIAIWKSVVESRHKGQTAPQPGIYQGGTVTYWDGSAWQTVTATDAKNNACRKKGDFSDQYPSP
ncbi:DUF4157 domain-containing protein [Pseudomonas sp. J452]|uniref:eCIS core domain-containing protein n=1 Tax=Pseudomonas sp. J452 TaxID=2898441 RepID=UPI0021ADFB64|nr:DUF4157 domain-containing protein [Pseudomonas sp. J452]UUY07427.1 DUF4157 domain-containing protein [Pseudomonas sp. J452]